MNVHDTNVCGFYGCARLSAVTVVTFGGWVQERCRPCAAVFVSWPPSPADLTDPPGAVDSGVTGSSDPVDLKGPT